MTTTSPKLTKAKLAIAKYPKSKATALRWYIKDHFGSLHNTATDESRAELALALERIKGRNAQAIVEICRDCVGHGADGNCRELVRNCEIKSCFLFIVRPYQTKSKVIPKNASPCAFSGVNASEVIGRSAPIKKSSKKELYNAPRLMIGS